LGVIHLIDSMLEAHLRAEVPLPAGVDVAFNAPDRRWGATVTSPTVNLFLWDIRRDAERLEAGIRYGRAADGTAIAARPDPTVRFRYLVTAWASDHRDEHQLLGAVLRCVLATEVIPPAHVPPLFADAGDVELTLASGEPRPNDFWSSLDGQLKPGLEVVLTMVVPLDLGVPLGPEISEVALRVDLEERGAEPPATAAATDTPGRDVARVRTRRGRTVVTSAVERNST
jgi:hypothetical protein